MSNSFLSASSIPGGLLPSPSANLFERSIGTLLSTFKYSVADPINPNANNVRAYQQPYQQPPPPQAQFQPQYSQPAPVNNVNVVMGPTGPVANGGMVAVPNNHKSVKKTTLYGEMMAVKLEKENKSGANLTLPSSTTYTNITLNAAAPNVPSQNFTNEAIKPADTANNATTSTNTFQIPPPIQQPTAVNPPQITIQSNYPPPPPPQPGAVAPQVIQINTQNNQQPATNYQNVTVQNAVPGTFQNISFQQPSNISIGSNYPQPQQVNKVNPPQATIPSNATNNTGSGQTIYPSPIQIPSIQQNVNNNNFQAPNPQPPPQISSVSNSGSSQMPSQKMEENANLLSNHLQQNCTPTLNYIVGVFMDSIDSMQQNIDFFQSGTNTNGFNKNSDNNGAAAPKINYHPNMLTLFNDGLIDDNANKNYTVNYNNNGTNGKDESKLINEYFNWDELLTDTEKATQQSQPVTLFNNVVPSQTLNVQQGQPQTLQLQPQQITVNGQPAQNIQQISIANPAQPQIQQQAITVQPQQIQLSTPQLQQQALPIQQVNVQNQPITITPQQTPQLRTQTLQTTANAPGQAQVQQQPVVVMVEPGTNYQTSVYPQNTINQNFVAQQAINSNQFNQQQPSTQINYTNNIITQTTQSTQPSIPITATNTIQNAEQPQTSQSLMFKGDTQDITRMTRVENTTTNPNGQLQDTKVLNKSLDNLNSTSTSITISNTNGTITDTANSNTTLDSVATNNTTTVSTTTKPRRKERPSTKPKPFKCPTCQQTFSRSHGNYFVLLIYFIY
ncbi:hypothetical protein PIROE2DRAFT_59571 [Piromyces sp. E2]|nr:hypothetical protein PIROE2DRAFT_59571 [Piromyces sp. E2]|eukprot:OUM66118.1 hypothetical protein PIROE2DRAFT_59571 [Piromyces sp. E2]